LDDGRGLDRLLMGEDSTRGRVTSSGRTRIEDGEMVTGSIDMRGIDAGDQDDLEDAGNLESREDNRYEAFVERNAVDGGVIMLDNINS
jgi:hypothetical protein